MIIGIASHHVLECIRLGYTRAPFVPDRWNVAAWSNRLKTPVFSPVIPILPAVRGRLYRVNPDWGSARYEVVGYVSDDLSSSKGFAFDRHTQEIMPSPIFYFVRSVFTAGINVRCMSTGPHLVLSAAPLQPNARDYVRILQNLNQLPPGEAHVEEIGPRPVFDAEGREEVRFVTEVSILS